MYVDVDFRPPLLCDPVKQEKFQCFNRIPYADLVASMIRLGPRMIWASFFGAVKFDQEL